MKNIGISAIWRHIYSIGLACIMALAVYGCSSFSTSVDSPEVDLAIKVAVWKVIENASDPAERQAKIVQISDDILGYLTDPENEQTAVTAIAGLVRSKIRWEKLDVSEKALVDYILAKATELLVSRLDADIIDPDQLVTVAAFVESVREAAEMASTEA